MSEGAKQIPIERSDSRRVFGIGAKLFAAFGVLAGGILLASAVAWLVFSNIERSVSGITEESVPNMVIALNLAELSAEIAATAPSIDASETRADHVREKADLQVRQRRLATLIEDLSKSGGASDQIAALSRLTDLLNKKLAELNQAVDARLRVAGERQSTLARLSRVHLRFEELLEPLVDDAVFDLVMSGERITAESTSTITDLVENGVGLVDGLLTIEAQGNLVMGLLAETVRLNDPALIQPLRERFTAAAASIDRNLRQLSTNEGLSSLQRAIDALLAFGRGDRNVFDLRAQMLRTEAAAIERLDWRAMHAALKSAHETFLLRLTPVVDDAAFDLVLTTEKIAADSTESLTELIDVGANTLYLLLALKAEGNLSTSLLNQAASTLVLSRLQPLRERFIASHARIERIMRQLPSKAVAEDFEETVTTLIEFGVASDSIFELRRRELELVTMAGASLEASRVLAVALGTEVAKVVDAAKYESDKAADHAVAAIDSGKISLLAISIAGLLCATAAMLAYVKPRIIRPLENMTAAMMQLAEGDTSVEVPYRNRNDEMGRMAQALGVFRDTAIEVQRTSLLEIEAARRRLVDAIESISEAFSLYDSEDRLVVCNEKYRTLLYPGIADEIAPGTSFEEIVRRAAERGYITDAEGRVEAWLDERITRHRNPGEPHIQQRADGRWIMVSERKTAEGGTVAVYSDITELKQREEELASKSNALEQLSSQLAKYLAPQVYDSIFSGRQEVKLSSRRRKLTVFFSDIAGFTETADRLESEELTELLNHYLTEMSQIALAHGATIDKYVGDAIVIFFGDPETRGAKEDALACVRMALAMQERMRQLETVWRDSGIENPLKCRMGINTGFCTVGNFGSEDRMDYTIIGGGVNLASRLESAATPGEILISYETYALVKDEISCEERGKIEVKGIAYPVATYAVLYAEQKVDDRPNLIRESHPKLRLEIEPDAMTTDEREEAIAVLRGAMGRLSNYE